MRTMQLICRVDTGWMNTWRSAAVHWGEGRGGWGVAGDHWIILANGGMK